VNATLLIPKENLNKFKSRDLIPLSCAFCHNTFYKPKNDIQRWLNGKYPINCCSNECRNKLKTRLNTITCLCKQCNVPIIRPLNWYKKCKFIFCSRSCSSTYWNINKTWGTNRSKLEVWLETQLTEKYSNLLIEYNKTNTINAELDIYIPSLKLAFELNGIFHYEPIFGKDKLQSYQNNDKRKYQACLEQGIELCIIDTHNIKYFKEKTSMRFLDIITKIVDNKMEPCEEPASS